jgi:hypothetical protein
VRRNPYAANASASFTAHAVGCGIKSSSLVEDAGLKDRIQRLWLAWTDEADADGLTDFYGLQAMAARAIFEAGECFIRLRSRHRRRGSGRAARGSARSGRWRDPPEWRQPFPGVPVVAHRPLTRWPPSTASTAPVM